MKDIKKIIKEKLVILDGALGTQLQEKGLPAGANPEIFCYKNQNILEKIHQEYCQVGSDVIYTSTFGANSVKLREYGCKTTRKLNRELALIAKKAAAGKVLVAGDIGPTGKLVKPFGSLEFEQAVDIFKEQVEGLLDAEVDLFVIETMIDIQEARAALLAVKELSSKFTAVSMTFEKNGFTLGGTSPLTALITLQSLGADCFGCNCSSGPEDMSAIIKKIKPYAKVPLLAKPNAGLPKLKQGKTVFEMKAKEFSRFLPDFIDSGVNLLGGCCGTTPAHIKEIKKKAASKRGKKVTGKSLAALTSARSNFIFSDSKPVTLIGECINPTGKKELSLQLQKGNLDLVKELARKQQQAGADILDINLAAAGVREKEIMATAVDLISRDIMVPLAVDSSCLSAIESFLRRYPGRALVNSVSADPVKNKKLLKIIAKYGAMFIGLPVGKKSLPKDLSQRYKNIQAIAGQAKKFKFSKNDFIIDAMVLAAASNPKGPAQTLATISWAKSKGYKTVIGLSNVSFGLPDRDLVNSAFLNLAQSRGLNCVIANPFSQKVISSKKAVDLLLGKKDSEKNFFKVFSQKESPAFSKKGLNKIENKVYRCILEGEKEKIKQALTQALSEKVKPESLLNKAVVLGLEQAGDFFDKKIYFLPQLVATAEAAREAFAFLGPKLRNPDQVKKTIIILATVKGDIHDIGKNIVGLILANHGFQVIDLGKDVSAEKIVKAAAFHNAPLVGLSALMTTTMVNMKEVVNLAKAKKLQCKFIVGGAVVNQKYARFLGAEYACDGLAAVKVAQKIIKK